MKRRKWDNAVDRARSLNTTQHFSNQRQNILTVFLVLAQIFQILFPSVAYAATTIGTNISTGGTLDVSATSTLAGLVINDGSIFDLSNISPTSGSLEGFRLPQKSSTLGTPTVGAGYLGYRTDTFQLQYYDGSSWISVATGTQAVDLTAFATHVVPATNNTYNVGAPTSSIKDLYASGTAYLAGLSLGLTGTITSNLLPQTTATYDLGNNILGWNRLFVSSSFVLSGGSSGFTASLSSLLPNTNNSYALGSPTKSFSDFYSSGTAYLTAAQVNGTLTSQSQVPFTNNTYDLGSANASWKDIYTSGTSYFGGTLKPKGNNTIDIGTASYSYKDLYSSGTVFANSILFSTSTNVTSPLTGPAIKFAATGTFVSGNTDMAGLDMANLGNMKSAFVFDTTNSLTNNALAAFRNNGTTMLAVYSNGSLYPMGGAAELGSDGLEFNTGNIIQLTGTQIIAKGLLRPNNNNLQDNGAATSSWRNAFVSGTAYLNNVNISGTCTGCGSGGSWDGSMTFGITPGTNNTYDIGAATTSIKNLYSSGTMYVGSGLLPKANNTVDIGSTTYGWKDIYASGTLYLGTTLIPRTNSVVHLGSAAYSLSNIFASGTMYVGTGILPKENSTIDIGSPTYSFNNLYTSGTAVLGAIQVTGANGVKHATNNFADLGGYGNAWRNAYVSGTLYTGGINMLNGSITGNMLPSVANTYSLGNSVLGWQDLWASSTINIWGATNGASLSQTGLTFNVNNAFNIGSATKAVNTIYVSGTSYLNGISLNGTVTPLINQTYDIGAYGNALRDIYSSGTAYFAGFKASASSSISTALVVGSSTIASTDLMLTLKGNPIQGPTIRFEDYQFANGSLGTLLGHNSTTQFAITTESRTQGGVTFGGFSGSDSIAAFKIAGLNNANTTLNNSLIGFMFGKSNGAGGITEVTSTQPLFDMSGIDGTVYYKVFGDGSQRISGNAAPDATTSTNRYPVGVLTVAASSTAAATGYNLIAATREANAPESIVFKVRADGQIFSDAGTTITSPADLAEMTRVSGDSSLYIDGTVVAQSLEDEVAEPASANGNRNYLGVATDRGVFMGSGRWGKEISAYKGTLSDFEKEHGIRRISMTGYIKIRVNDENGPIAPGDLLGISNSSGEARKAKPGDVIVGMARAAFPPKADAQPLGNGSAASAVIDPKNGDIIIASPTVDAAGNIDALSSAEQRVLNSLQKQAEQNVSGNETPVSDAGTSTVKIAASAPVAHSHGLIEGVVGNGSGYGAANVLQTQGQSLSADGSVTAGAADALSGDVNDVQNLVVRKIGSFHGELRVKSHAYFDQDSAGLAKFLLSSTFVTVKFNEPYRVAPVITVTPENLIIGSYWVTSVSAEGFTVRLEKAQPSVVTLGWHAVAVPDVQLFVSDGTHGIAKDEYLWGTGKTEFLQQNPPPADASVALQTSNAPAASSNATSSDTSPAPSSSSDTPVTPASASDLLSPGLHIDATNTPEPLPVPTSILPGATGFNGLDGANELLSPNMMPFVSLTRA